MSAIRQTHHNGISKIERYNWTSAGDRGVFMELRPDQINIDHNYQRERNPSKGTILSIANSFSWVAFGTLAVAMRPDGSLWCIDGQGRLMAARKRSDVITVPCMVYEVKDAQHEAMLFDKINSIRSPLNSLEKFKPLAFGGDEVAVKVQKMLDETGYRLSKHRAENSVKCATLLRNCIKANEHAARAAWSVVASVCAGGFVHERLLGGMFYLANTQPDTINRENTDKLVLVGPTAILQSIQEAVAYEGGGPKSCAKGICRVLNKGRRNRIEIA